MVASAIVFLSLGLPCLALGIYFRREAAKEAERVSREKEKTRGKKKKKGKADKDQPGKERGSSGGMSLILGGLVCSAIGFAFLAKYLMQ